jgi:hypothetical protein
MKSLQDRWLTIDEVRIASDLRIRHAKVDELYNLVSALKERHAEADVVKYAHQPMLTDGIHKFDQIYRCFVKLEEENIAERA